MKNQSDVRLGLTYAEASYTIRTMLLHLSDDEPDETFNQKEINKFHKKLMRWHNEYVSSPMPAIEHTYGLINKEDS